jgi:plasmid maintenance system killer protein
MHSQGAIAREVMGAIEAALKDRSRMHAVKGPEENTFAVRVNADLRAIIRIKGQKAIVITIMQHEP